jgi:CBS domain-containing protein
LSREELVRELEAPVRGCMRKPITCTPEDSISSLLANMVIHDIGAIIVVKKEVPIGIITEKDILERSIMKDKDVYKTQANEIMSTPLITIEHDRSIKEAIELMKKHNIRRLAVTDNRALVGLVTERRLSINFLSKII